ncbi:hypothetical protein ACLOJK_000828 [Asimina triloba]
MEVVIDSATGSIADYACEVEITECEPLPDGRFYLEVGNSKLKDAGAFLQQMATGAAEMARTWIRRVRETSRTEFDLVDRRSRRMEFLQAEEMPGPHDPERFSFWLVNLLNLRPSERLELLRLRDARERISRGLVLLRAEEQGCRVQ